MKVVCDVEDDYKLEEDELKIVLGFDFLSPPVHLHGGLMHHFLSVRLCKKLLEKIHISNSITLRVMKFGQGIPTRHNTRITRGIHVKFTTSSPRVFFHVYNDHLWSYFCFHLSVITIS